MGNKGFRAIANDYFLALMGAQLTRSEYKVILAVIHHTWGWRRDWSEDLSLTKFTNLTKLSRPGVIKAIGDLEAKRVITVVRRGKQVASYRINGWELWQVDSKPHLTRTSKVQLTSTSKTELTSDTSKTLLENVGNFTRTGKVSTPATTHIKEKRNLLKKVNIAYQPNGYSEENFSSLEDKGGFNKRDSSTSHRKTVSRGKDLKRLITAYLRDNGASSVEDIRKGIGWSEEKMQSIRCILTQNKGRIFNNPSRGVWGVISLKE